MSRCAAKGLTYRLIGDQLDVSASRARQIHMTGLRLLDHTPAIPFDLVNNRILFTGTAGVGKRGRVRDSMESTCHHHFIEYDG